MVSVSGFVGEFQQVLPVLVPEHRLRQLPELRGRDPAVMVGDALQAGDLETLAFLDDLHEDRGFGQRVVRARVQPREAALKRLHLQLAALQETLVHARDLKLPARRGFDTPGHIHDLVGVEIKTHHRVVRFRVRRFLLDRQAVARSVELRDPVALRIVDPVAEDRSLAILLGRAYRLAKKAREARAVEDVVAQNQTHGVIADEIRADQESLGKTVRGRLLGIADANPVVGAVAQQTTETAQILWRRDQENIADTSQKQRR